MAPNKRTPATPAKRTPVAASSFINDCLHDFNEAELKDVIRVAQRCLKAKVQRARADASASGAKLRWRFWDRPLELDWGSDGIPKIQYPLQKSKGEPEVDWSVFKLLKGSALEPMQVDWEIFELLAPKVAKQEEVSWDIFQLLGPVRESAEPEAEPETIDFSAVDWSGNRLPHLKVNSSPPLRRPGHTGRVRTGQHHRPIEPSRRKGSEVGFGAPPDLPSLLAAQARQPAFPAKKMSPRVSRGRVNSRFQQLGGRAR